MLRTLVRPVWVMVFLALAGLPSSAHAETIRIENASPDSFHYVIRRQGDTAPDEAVTLQANQYHTYASSEALIITYWTDQPRIATLEPNRTYRLLDRQQGELRQVTSVLKPVTPPPALKPNEPAPGRAADDAAEAAHSAAPADVRVVRVLAVADQTYRRIVKPWQQRIRDAVAGASRYYETHFGLRFVVAGIREWDYRGLTDKPNERWRQLLKISPGQADIVVAFVGFGDYYKAEDRAYYVGHLGQGMPFGQHVIVSGERYVHPNRDRAVLVHELAHLFGAFHVDNERSIMQAGFRDVPSQDIIDGRLHIDPALQEVIRLAREVDFRRGVASLSAEARQRIRSLCKTHRRAAEKNAPDPVTQGQRYLQAREEARREATADREPDE